MRRTKLVVLIICIITGVYALSGIAAYHKQQAERIGDKKRQLLAITAAAAESMDSALVMIRAHAKECSRMLETSVDSLDAVNMELFGLLKTCPMVYSAGIAFEPFAYQNDRRLYGPFLRRNDSGITSYQLETVYDYTASSKKSAWYANTIRGGDQWSEPFYGEASKQMLIMYQSLFYRVDHTGKKIPSGVLVIALSLDHVAEYIRSIDLGAGGYGALVSPEGKYIYHPNDEYVMSGKTVCQIGEDANDATRITWWNNRARVKQGIYDHESVTTGLTSWFIFAPLPSVNWSLHTTFLKSDLITDYDGLRKKLIVCVVRFNIFLLSLFSCLLLHFSVQKKSVWVVSSLVAACLTASIAVVWKISLACDTDTRNIGLKIYNVTSLNVVGDSLLKNYFKKYRTHAVYKVPTGIFLNGIDFVDNSTLAISGLIWQKFTDAVPPDLQKDLRFPGCEVVYLRQQYQHTYATYDLYRWEFKIILKKKMHYRKYPLIQERINLQVQQKDGKYKVMPVPDIDAYKLTNPASLPGISGSIILPGWSIIETYFSMSTQIHNVDFGNGDDLLNNFYPTFNYHFIIKREFVDVFISNLTPLILVMFLLFIGLIISNVSPEYQSRFKSDMPKIIGFYSGLLFIVVFAHIGIRAKVNSDSLFLLEYCYLVSYFAFFYVTITTMLYQAEYRGALIHYKDNLLYKALFWPLIMGAVFVVSLVTFY